MRRSIVRKFNQQLASVVQKDWVKVIRDQFPYKIPSGYLQWEDLSEIIGQGMKFLHIKAPTGLRERIDRQGLLWASQPKPPIYCIKSELIEQFRHTDVGDKPELLSDLKCPVPSFVALFPPGEVKSPGDKDAYIDYLVVNCVGERFPVPPSYFAIDNSPPRVKDVFKMAIFWSGLDSKGNIFISYRGIRHDGTFQRSGFSTEDVEIQQISLQIRELVLQMMMAIEYCPELVLGEVTPKEVPSKGFSKPKGNILYPHWLGRHHQKSVSSGSKKSSHWRRGHWRRQPRGSRQNPEYYYIWIEPVLINKE